MQSEVKKQPFYFIFLLILAGEAVFILPFVLPRIFRPTVLDLFRINNLELGYCYSIYGFVALISYLIGGWVADRFPPGRIMGVALLMTAAGGIYLASYPSYTMLKWLYGYWGMTTILLFWAAMIKATRIWGGADRQGKAFGFLDGGRGLVAAGFGSIGLWVLSLFVVGDFEGLSVEDRLHAFRQLILTFSSIVAGIAVLTFLFLKDNKAVAIQSNKIEIKKEDIKRLLTYKSIWLMMIIILTGYCGYKITDVYSLYAKEVMMYDEISAAGIGTMLLYIRPLIGVAVGFLADRSKSSIYLTLGFIFLLIGSGLMASGWIIPSTKELFIGSIFLTALGVYSIRCLYFAVMEEGKIPPLLTGTAVGIISFIGYTPDIFMGPLLGYLLDNFPNPLNFQYVFGTLGFISALGLIACLLFLKLYGQKNLH